MHLDNLMTTLLIIGLTSSIFYGMYRISRYAFIINLLMLGVFIFFLKEEIQLVLLALYLICPLILVNIGMYVFLHETELSVNGNLKYQVNFATDKGNFK